MPLPRSRGLVLLVACVVAASAWARAPDPAPAGPDQFPDSFRAGWGWRALPTLPAVEITDVAVRADGALAVVADDGTVWVSKDGGDRWRRALSASRGFGPGSADEELLLGVEARLGELLDEPGASGGVDEDLTEDEAQDLAAQAAQELEDASRDAVEEVRADLNSDPLLQTTRRVGLPSRIWFLDDTLVVGRIDGTYASDDLGELWVPALDVQVTAITRGPSGWVIGAVDGVRVGGAPDTWADLAVSLDGLVIWDAATDERGVHLASEEGLWHSADGRRWLGEGVLDERVLALLPDSDTTRLWLATESGVQIGLDGGRQLLPPTMSPAGAASMIRVGPDHVLTAGATGVWETIDGGESWSPLQRGLFSRDAHALVRLGDQIWLAAEGGLFRIQPERGDAPELALVPWVGVETLVDAAMRRRGVRPEPIGARLAAAAMPRLIVEGRYVTRHDLGYSADPTFEEDIYEGEVEVRTGGGARRLEADDWQVIARLRWTPRKRQSITASSATILGDDLVFDVSQPDIAPMLDRLGASYGVDLSRSVAELYYQRQALASERPAVRDRPILEQVAHELRILEIEARLDALTDGALTAWQRNREDG